MHEKRNEGGDRGKRSARGSERGLRGRGEAEEEGVVRGVEKSIEICEIGREREKK